jgi:hypothetical protein
MNIILPIVFGFTGFLIVAWIGWRWNTRKTKIRIDAEPPADFPVDGFSHDIFEKLLTRFVSGGKIDYETWHLDTDARGELESYLAAVSRFGPQKAPSRFSGEHDVLAYWMYAYNALVIKVILDRWPLKSVTDFKAPIEMIKGLGFFYNLEFPIDGYWYTLYAIEKEKVVGQAKDPRVHFVLNCGSEACPAIRPELPTGADLEPYLARAATNFVADTRNVAIDHENKEVRLSTIFKWYRKEFIADLQRRALPSTRGVIDYISAVAPERLAEELAGLENYKTVFVEYDWAVNNAGVSDDG